MTGTTLLHDLDSSLIAVPISLPPPGDQGASAVAGLGRSTQQFPIGMGWLLEKGPDFVLASPLGKDR